MAAGPTSSQELGLSAGSAMPLPSGLRRVVRCPVLWGPVLLGEEVPELCCNGPLHQPVSPCRHGASRAPSPNPSLMQAPQSPWTQESPGRGKPRPLSRGAGPSDTCRRPGLLRGGCDLPRLSCLGLEGQLEALADPLLWAVSGAGCGGAGHCLQAWLPEPSSPLQAAAAASAMLVRPRWAPWGPLLPRAACPSPHAPQRGS